MIKNNLKNLVSEGKIGEVFDNLEIQFAELPVMANKVHQLRSQHNKYLNDKNKGVVDYFNLNVTRNQITDSLLGLIDSIPQEEFKGLMKSSSLDSFNPFQLDVTKMNRLDVPWIAQKLNLDSIFSLINNRKIEFILKLEGTQQFWLIRAYESMQINDLAKYIAAKLFPNMKMQHFLWRLQDRNVTITQSSTLKASGVAQYKPLDTYREQNNFVNLTAEYMNKEFIPKTNDDYVVWLKSRLEARSDVNDININQFIDDYNTKSSYQGNHNDIGKL